MECRAKEVLELLLRKFIMTDEIEIPAVEETAEVTEEVAEETTAE